MDENEQQPEVENREERHARSTRRKRANHFIIIGVVVAPVLLIGGVAEVVEIQARSAAEQTARKAKQTRRAALREACRLQKEQEEAARAAESAKEAEETPAPQEEEPAAEPAEQVAEPDPAEQEPATEAAATDEQPTAEEGEKAEEPTQIEEPAAEERSGEEAAPEPEKPAEPEPKSAEKPEPKPAAEETIAVPPLTGPEAQGSAADEAYAALVKQLLEAGNFRAVAAALGKRLGEEMPNLMQGRKFNPSGYRSSRTLAPAIDLCLLAAMVPEGDLQRLSQDGKKGRAFFEWLLLSKAQPLHQLLRWQMLEGGNGQNMAYALRTLDGLWQICPPKDRDKYLNLMLACALVHPGIVNAPNMLRNKAKSMTIPEIFAYFTEADRKRQLLTDIRKMSVERLLHVVDFRLPRSEVDWAQENMDYKRRDWGNAYEAVDYMMERATANKDPYKEYTFAEILKLGGVCRDQAYYCGMGAKCKGIPAIFVTGDGDRGPHAWVVLLVDDGNWVQVNNYGYTSGRFVNPCSGRAMHESVYLRQTRQDRAEKVAPAGDGIMLSRLLALLGETQSARDVARWVTGSFPSLSAAWGNLIAVMQLDEEKAPVSKETWKKIDAELMKAAAKNAELADLAGEIEEKYLGGTRRNAVKQAKRSAGDSRADVVVAAVEREARALAEAKDYRGLAALYKKQLKDYTDRGDIFEQLVQQYMTFLDEADARSWTTMAKDTEKLFDKKVRGNGSDYFKITKEVAIQKLIAQAWGRAGNKKKAQKMYEDAEQRLDSAKERQ